MSRSSPLALHTASESCQCPPCASLQLAKALLAGNARGQLTTIKAEDPGAEESKVTSSAVTYLVPRGAPRAGLGARGRLPRAAPSCWPSLRAAVPAGEAPVVLLSRGEGQHLRNLGETAKVRAAAWLGTWTRALLD